MDNEELYVLLADTVDGNKCLSIWKKRNPKKDVVLVNNVKFEEESKKLTKLTLMFTKYETTKEFNNFWRKFEGFWGEFVKNPDFSLQTLHFIFLAEDTKTEHELIFKKPGFFKSLKCKTIEFDCGFTVSLLELPSYDFPPLVVKDNGIRVNLGLTTTSVIVRSPGAQIIQLRNNDRTKFSLKEIRLITKSYPMGIILCNVNLNVIKKKKLKVYWNDNEPETHRLKNFKSATEHVIFMKLTQPALSDKSEREKGGGEGWQYYRFIVDSCLGEECDV
jgi:hypothetical protein